MLENFRDQRDPEDGGLEKGDRDNGEGWTIKKVQADCKAGNAEKLKMDR